ncbi:hypothetical protein OIE67_53665 [Nonomuraea fuscirosea]|uniref:hypothetical protein n=1 Tax=Nonomuraea fuscirosea TaxID=1291556 RepID=UPI002DDB2AE4|nr:hypothetical protein [Nonomuraea fuscirosea]WSA52761.1 hypothetical protein OIE67_53665 [Nonomuraea fuscirosea]
MTAGPVTVLVFSFPAGRQGVSTLPVAPMAATIGTAGIMLVLGAFAVAYAIGWSVVVPVTSPPRGARPR